MASRWTLQQDENEDNGETDEKLMKNWGPKKHVCKKGLKCVRGLKILLFRPHKIIDFWSIFDRFWTHLGALLGRLGSHVAPKWPTQTFKQSNFRVFDPSEILSNFNEILTSLGNGPKSKKRLKCDRGARFWPPWNGKMAPRGPPLDFEGARKNGQKSTST